MALFRKKKAKTEEEIQAELDAKKKASEALKNLISEDDDEKVDIVIKAVKKAYEKTCASTSR